MSIRRRACEAFKQDALDRAEAKRKAEAAERLRHYDGARRKMEELFSISDARGKNNAWGLAHFTEHATPIQRSHPYLGRSAVDTVTRRAVEFLVEGLRFRVTESRPRRDRLESIRPGMMSMTNGNDIARIKQDYPEYDYVVRVHLPELPKRRFRKQEWSWFYVDSKASLGALLAARGWCCL